MIMIKEMNNDMNVYCILGDKTIGIKKNSDNICGEYIVQFVVSCLSVTLLNILKGRSFR
jgi:hypothetical protein